MPNDPKAFVGTQSERQNGDKLQGDLEYIQGYWLLAAQGPYSQSILRLKVAPNLPIYEKLLKNNGCVSPNFGTKTYLFLTKSNSRSPLTLEEAPKPGRTKKSSRRLLTH